jgi:hypothetical protein
MIALLNFKLSYKYELVYNIEYAIIYNITALIFIDLYALSFLLYGMFIDCINRYRKGY